jgi:hypothetical protein
MLKAKGDTIPHFPMEHVVKYGLKIMTRNPETSDVLSVRCQFCIYFGRENDPVKERQRAKRGTKMTWIGNWRVDLYQKHHKSEHPTIWLQYQACSEDEKRLFFKNKTAFSNTILPHIIQSHPLELNIKASIIDVIIGDLFFHPDDHGGVTQQRALQIFDRKGDEYQVIIKNPMQFHLMMSQISRGSSFRLIEGAIADIREITGILNDVLANFRMLSNWVH